MINLQRERVEERDVKALWIDQREGAISNLLLQLDYKATPR